jgi:NAD(P)-dependent dehydrogenase (short-subunit alcohol dehydrogenase family)
MSNLPNPADFALPAELAEGIQGKRVFITGAGRHDGIGQALALAAGLNGAESVGVHFHSSYDDGLETVAMIRAGGGRAFPVQADVTNPRDVWAMRSHTINKMGGKPPNVVICNSGASEKGYLLGKPPKELEDEIPARRRARVRQVFVDNLAQSRMVIDTKLDGSLAMTHLWASEALYAGEPLRIVYVSSRQAVDPGAGVPGYCAANWAMLSLPQVLRVNLGRQADQVTAFSVGYPFVVTSMTRAYEHNTKVFGRWQPRMLSAAEAAKAFMALLARPNEELAEKFFQVEVDRHEGGGDSEIEISWTEVGLNVAYTPVAWSKDKPIVSAG